MQKAFSRSSQFSEMINLLPEEHEEEIGDQRPDNRHREAVDK